LSSRIDHENNKRDIVTIPEKVKVPKIQGIVSPYLSKVSVPSERSARKSNVRSSVESILDSKRKMSMLADKNYG
jgi:hypothetical protein